MNKTASEKIALKFVECINNQDLDGLVALMTEDITMVAYEDKPEVGLELLREGFRGYFSDYPEYKIHISKVTRSGNDIAMTGKTTGSHIPPEIEAQETVIWVAKIKDNLVSEWLIFSDLDHLQELPQDRFRNMRDPKFTVLQFNEYINAQDILGLSSLMTPDHTFIDRKGKVDRGKDTMTKGWIDFFDAFPEYKNTFLRVESQGNIVFLYGFATWEQGSDPDHAIWMSRVEDDLVAEWRIYEDTENNVRKFAIKLKES
jgi:ketosteroid isomerase-like protein